MTRSSQLASFGLFDARVPRYTSYPTAPHFGLQVGPQTFARWIEAIPAGAEISLYVHVPFCRHLCWFCACRTQGTQSDDPLRAYVKVLKAEMALVAARLAPGVRLRRLHWGGGTPTILGPDLIADLAQAIFKVAPLAQGAEFSVEIDPNEIDAERLDALIACGMNRASIGVQDFDPDIQRTIGRVQSYQLTYDVAQMIRDRGVDSLNADILYGLPGQTIAGISRTVEQLLEIRPDRVALYGYAHVPWMSRRQQMIPSDQIPVPQARLGLFDAARALFVARGYAEIGIDHFATPTDKLLIAANAGKLRRNFQGYTDDQSQVLIGLGASSISRFPQGFAQNISATAGYGKAIREGKFATHRGHVFEGEDRLRARIIETLMCDFAVNVARVAAECAAPIARVRDLMDDVAVQFPGMVVLIDDVLFIPDFARPLVRIIARAFDAYDHSKAQHSTAV